MNKFFFSSKANRSSWVQLSILGASILVVLIVTVLVLNSPGIRPKTAADPASTMSAASHEDGGATQMKSETAWGAEVQEEIGRTEYQITWQEQTALPHQEAAYQAPNRANNFRSHFTQEGIQLQPRTRTADDWQWSLHLTGLGYADDIQPVAGAELSPTDNRIAYHRAEITEWYVNGEMGLEQGFTIHQPPASARNEQQDNQLILELAIASNLRPELVDDDGDHRSRAIDFKTAGGTRVLRYSDLVVLDANERALPATM